MGRGFRLLPFFLYASLVHKLLAICGGVLLGICFNIGWDVFAWNVMFVGLYVTIALLM